MSLVFKRKNKIGDGMGLTILSKRRIQKFINNIDDKDSATHVGIIDRFFDGIRTLRGETTKKDQLEEAFGKFQKSLTKNSSPSNNKNNLDKALTISDAEKTILAFKSLAEASESPNFEIIETKRTKTVDGFHGCPIYEFHGGEGNKIDIPSKVDSYSFSNVLKKHCEYKGQGTWGFPLTTVEINKKPDQYKRWNQDTIGSDYDQDELTQINSNSDYEGELGELPSENQESTLDELISKAEWSKKLDSRLQISKICKAEINNSNLDTTIDLLLDLSKNIFLRPYGSDEYNLSKDSLAIILVVISILLEKVECFSGLSKVQKTNINQIRQLIGEIVKHYNSIEDSIYKITDLRMKLNSNNGDNTAKIEDLENKLKSINAVEKEKIGKLLKELNPINLKNP
ncbi:MAG: hypothetical protein ACK5Z5_00905 [Neisseriaceae bacterium]